MTCTNGKTAVKCIENNHAPCDGSMLDADGVLLRCCFLLV